MMLLRSITLRLLAAAFLPLGRAQEAWVRDVSEVRMPASPDSNSPAFWRNGRFYWYGSHGSPWLSSGPGQFGPWETKPVKVASADVSPKWMEAIWPESNGTIWGWYLMEPVNLIPGTTLTAPKIGAAFSTDGGATMVDLGIVLESGDGLDPNAQNGYFAGGHGDPSVIVDRTYQYAYIFFGNYAGAVTSQGVCVARMALSDRGMPVGKVQKYHNGSWTEPGLGGRVTPIFPAKRQWNARDPDAFWGPAVHWNTYLNCYVMLLNHASGYPGWSQEGIYVSFCADLTRPETWTTPRRILTAGELGDPGAFYAQVIGLEADGTDRKAGQTARLYVHGVSKWEIDFSVPDSQPISVYASAGVESGTLAVGESTWLTASAIGTGPFTYEWQRNGVPIPGATGSLYRFRATATSDTGVYTVMVSNSRGSTRSTPLLLTVTQPAVTAPVAPAAPSVPTAPTAPAAKPNAGNFLSNLSVRTVLNANSPDFTVGFALRGTEAKSLVVRAVGPTLASFGLTNAAADPRLELFNAAGKSLTENNDWLATDAEAFAAVGAFALPAGSRDAGTALTLPVGNGSARITAPGGGAILAEIYDGRPSEASRLINLSARGEVGSGEQVLVAGFSVTGSGTKRLLIRALGPWLGTFGIARTVPRPVLSLYDASGKEIAVNGGWDSAIEAVFAEAGAMTLTPGSLDSALVVTVPAGASYSAVVRSADGIEGQAMLEIYELP